MQVTNYICAKRELLEMFGVEGDFLIRTCIDKKWELDTGGDLPLLKFGHNDKDVQTCVIVKRDNKLMIFKKEKYTLVVALDCIKICFIFENKNHISALTFKAN